jgi:hypothetical protein
LLAKHAEHIIEFVVNAASGLEEGTASPTVLFDSERFVSATKKLICYYGDNPEGDRYLIQYQDCAAKLKVLILGVYEWDSVMASVMTGGDVQGSGDNGERSDREVVSGLQSLVRFYAYTATVDNLLGADVVLAAKDRAPPSFIMSEFGYSIAEGWSVQNQNAAQPTASPDGGDAIKDTSSSTNSTTTLIGIIVGCLAFALLALLGVVVYFQNHRQTKNSKLLSGKGFQNRANSPALSTYDWDGVARALADHATDAKSGWGNDGSSDNLAYERVMGLLSGAASVAPSIGYLDVQKHDNLTGVDAHSVHSEDSFIYDSTYMPAHFREGEVVQNPLHNRDSFDSKGPEYDDYLAIEDDGNEVKHSTNGGQVQSTTITTVPGRPPVVDPAVAAADAAHKLANLLSMKALCEQNLEEVNSGDQDEFSAATREMLQFTQANLTSQMDIIRRSVSPPGSPELLMFGEPTFPLDSRPVLMAGASAGDGSQFQASHMTHFGAISPDPMKSGPSGHFYPSQAGLGVEPIVQTPTLSRAPRPSRIEAATVSATGAAGFTMAGAAGEHSHLINGVFSRVDTELVNEKQVYKKINSADEVVCWYGPHGYWIISSPARKKKNEGIGWAKTFERGLASPQLAVAWLVFDASGYQPQPAAKAKSI